MTISGATSTALTSTSAQAAAPTPNGLTQDQQALADSVVGDVVGGTTDATSQTQAQPQSQTTTVATGSDAYQGAVATTTQVLTPTGTVDSAATSVLYSTAPVNPSTIDPNYPGLTARHVAILTLLGVSPEELAAASSSNPSAYDVEGYIQQIIANPTQFDAELGVPSGTTEARLQAIPSSLLQNASLPADTGQGQQIPASQESNVQTETYTDPSTGQQTSQVQVTPSVPQTGLTQGEEVAMAIGGIGAAIWMFKRHSASKQQAEAVASGRIAGGGPKFATRTAGGAAPSGGATIEDLDATLAKLRGAPAPDASVGTSAAYERWMDQAVQDAHNQFMGNLAGSRVASGSSNVTRSADTLLRTTFDDGIGFDVNPTKLAQTASVLRETIGETAAADVLKGILHR